MPSTIDLAAPSFAGFGIDPQRLATLERNLAALSHRSPRAAEAIRRAPARADVAFSTGEDGAVTGEADGRALASKRRPLAEAQTLAGSIDLTKAATVVLLGFGLGHHAAAVAERMKDAGAVVAFEPDVPLLRAVLERVDHSRWILQSGFVLLTEAEDGAEMAEALRGLEAPLSVGIAVVEHAASRPRLGGLSARFAETFTRAVGHTRMHVITTMVQTDVTVRNELMNADHYVSSAGVDDLEGAAAGRPAIVVSAGPSLRRNIALLKDPSVRQRCVIIAVQTVLKTLLAEGIRPHYVTALDYHEISRRFYEGLTPADVEGVTLVAEAKANPAILDAFPGVIRVPACPELERALGPAAPGKKAELPAGATVAHLAYYLARHMAADPVILVGQDLAFTDGQYYASGAAIHRVWSAELNEFHTLEMFEWERIARGGANLHRSEDHLGRPVYTDDQMAAYLAQFERDFKTDRDLGLRIIDATEGGVRKRHTTPMTLADALSLHAQGRPVPAQSPPGAARAQRRDGPRIAAAGQRIGALRADVRRIARLSRETLDLLGKVRRFQSDRDRANRLIDQIQGIRAEVESLDPAYPMVQRLNQLGALRRFKADRLLRLDPGIDPVEKQSRQIERDAENVRWFEQCAEVLADLLAAAETALAGGPKRTRDQLEDAPAEGWEARRADAGEKAAGVRCGAVITATGADTAAEFLGEPALRRTLRRLARCRRLSSVIVATDAPDAVRRAAEGSGVAVAVRTFEELGLSADSLLARRQSIRRARMWSEACWRGGLGRLTVFDEALDPRVAHAACEREGLDAALVIGADWCLLDPRLCDELIARHAEAPESQPLVFSQAAPGLAGCVAGRELLGELAHGVRQSAPLATMGGLLGYIPGTTRSDPIAKPCCVQIPTELRDAAVRLVPGPELERALRPYAGALDDAPAATVAAWAAAAVPAAPRELIIELSAHRPAAGEGSPRRRWLGPEARRDMSPDLAARLAGELAPGALVTFGGRGDPLLHPRFFEVVGVFRASGAAGIHVRTDGLCGADLADRLPDAGVDVVSVDLLADCAPTYRGITGVDRYGEALHFTERLLARRTAADGLPGLWVAPRMTRCDAVYAEIEPFYQRWTMLAGHAVLDPLPRAQPGERIEPLELPPLAAARRRFHRMLVLADGRVPVCEHNPSEGPFAADLSARSATAAWADLLARRGVC
ncbi:MAG: DUF115 domain-containing protein [Phycisphaerales bacterium]|nr:DUF115 domain-containing protein [Phycisphaerales bacterium]